jgi:2,3-dihydroxybenzoate decarboxylase/5-carboxyvanillate decarboxylase
MVEFNRREMLLTTGVAVGAAAAPAIAQAAGGSTRHRRIATEEAVVFPEQVEAMRRLVTADPTNTYHDYRLWRMITGVEPSGKDYHGLLSDIEGKRLAEMDRLGVDMQLLACTAPGVQMLAPDVAIGVAQACNDRFGDLLARRPTRFAALTTVAPQAPAQSVKEMERAITKLKLNGFMVNSHTNNKYLDEPEFWPILEAAEALDRPIYIHPRTPSEGMVAPYRQYNMQSALWGYGAEVSLHVVRLIMSGVLDRFPKLQFAIGHMGEGVHFWFWRLDHMGQTVRGLKLKPSEYFKRNFTITTSGQEFVPALKYSIDVLGPENVMWAIDYPYQESESAVKFMDGADISESHKALVYHGNAERLFHIAPAKA